MSEQGFLAQKPRSPGSLAMVIALHAAAIGAVMLAKSEVVTTEINRLRVKHIPIEPPPPPEPPKPQPEAKAAPPQKSVIKYVPPEVPVRSQDPVVLGSRSEDPVIFNPGPIGEAEPRPEPAPIPVPIPKPEPVPEPVRKEAQIDSRSKLQPPYPASEERAEVEGSVTVLVVIGTDGRVKRVEKVRAANDAFFRATEQQALRHWRFKPATVDGRPVESRKTMTVHFQLQG